MKKKKFRIQLLIALVVFLFGVSIISMLYLATNKPVVYVSPGIVTAPSPTAAPVQPLTRADSYGRSSRTPVHYHVTPMSHGNAWSGASSFKIHTTSSAQMYSIGGGGGGGLGMTGSSGGSSSRGIRTSGGGGVTMPMTTFVAMASNRQVAQPEAEEAPQMARTLRRAPGPPNPGTPPPEENQLVEHPIGGPWCLLFLAFVYTIRHVVRLKRRNC